MLLLFFPKIVVFILKSYLLSLIFLSNICILLFPSSIFFSIEKYSPILPDDFSLKSGKDRDISSFIFFIVEKPSSIEKRKLSFFSILLFIFFLL